MQNRLPLLLLLLALVAGCARPAPPSPPLAPAEPAPVAPVADPQPAAPAPSAPAQAPKLPQLATLPAGVQHVTLDSAAAIDQHGLYFMDLASGKLDAWLLPKAEGGWPTIWGSTTPDERWVRLGSDTDSYLVRRSDGAVFQWATADWLIYPGPGVFLARRKDEAVAHGCFLLDQNLKPIATFTLDGACAPADDLAFSPDGQMVALHQVRTEGPVWLVAVATGAVQRLATFAAPQGQSAASLSVRWVPARNEWLVAHGLGAWDGGQSTRLSRFSRDGKLLQEQTLPGWMPQVSPDGRWLAYTEYRGLLGQTVVVQEYGAAQPTFRIAGGLWANWLAGSQELLITSSQGYQFVAASGTLKAAPFSPGGRQFHPFVWFVPAPDDPNRFLTGANVVDRTGKVLRELHLAERYPGRFAQVAWGPSAQTYHFVATPMGGKGYEGEHWNFIAPKLQHPPFPDRYPLQVADPQGDCLNLRSKPSVAGDVIRCLPTGTKLALPADLRAEDRSRWDEGKVWLQVATEQGETGWVALNTGSVAYAD